MGHLQRYGLVLEVPELALDIDVEIEEPDKGEIPSEANVDSSGSEFNVGVRTDSTRSRSYC